VVTTISIAEILQGMGLISKCSTIDISKTISAGSTETGTVSAPSGRGYIIDKITFSKCRDTVGDQIITDELYVEFRHKRMVPQGRMETFRVYALESAYDYEHNLLILLSRDDELSYNFVNSSTSDLVWGFTLHVYSYPIENEVEILNFLKNPYLFLLSDLKDLLEEIRKALVKKKVEIPEVEVVPRPKPKPVPVKKVEEIPIKGVGWE